jgi:RNA polymerase sigma-70 factor (ECF subfamily)
MIDPVTLGRLFDRHSGALVLYARQWSDVPEDAVQDAFLALARQRDVPDEPAAWLFRAVRNAAISAGRSTVRRKRREAAASTREAWFSRVDDRIDGRAAVAALEALPADLREVVVARIWGGLTLEQVAAIQGCGLTTAHRRFHEALARLNERLSPACEARS